MKSKSNYQKKRSLELFDESENPTVFGKIILVFCAIVVLAVIIGIFYYEFLKIRFFLTH